MFFCPPHWYFMLRFAKCETFGFSVMDIGVGSFVFCAGLTSPQARGKKTLKSSIITTLRSVLPLLILGVIRYFQISAVTNKCVFFFVFFFLFVRLTFILNVKLFFLKMSIIFWPQTKFYLLF